MEACYTRLYRVSRAAHAQAKPFVGSRPIASGGIQLAGLTGYLLATICCGLLGCAGVSDPLIAGGVPVVSGPERDETRSSPPCVEVSEPATETHRAMFDLLNQYRAANGLPELIYSRRLEISADAYVQDMAQRGYFAHVNPEGQNPGDRALAQGFCHRYVGENLAAGQKTAERAMQAWINSPSHNENMLDARYVYVGMGHYVDAEGRSYWAQEFSFSLP